MNVGQAALRGAVEVLTGACPSATACLIVALIVFVPACAAASATTSSAVCAKQKHTGMGRPVALCPTWVMTASVSTTAVSR